MFKDKIRNCICKGDMPLCTHATYRSVCQPISTYETNDSLTYETNDSPMKIYETNDVRLIITNI